MTIISLRAGRGRQKKFQAEAAAIAAPAWEGEREFYVFPANGSAGSFSKFQAGAAAIAAPAWEGERELCVSVKISLPSPIADGLNVKGASRPFPRHQHRRSEPVTIEVGRPPR